MTLSYEISHVLDISYSAKNNSYLDKKKLHLHLIFSGFFIYFAVVDSERKAFHFCVSQRKNARITYFYKASGLSSLL